MDRPVVRRAIRVSERYGQDAGGYLAASIAYYGFLSVFPLLLLGLSIVGYLLAGNVELEARFAAEIAAAVPGLQALVGKNLTALQEARASAGVIGLAGLLWTGAGVVGAGRNTVRRVFREGPAPTGIGDKVVLLGLTVGLGLVAVVATGASAAAASLESDGPVGVVLRVAAFLVGFVLDMGLFLLTYRVLSRRDRHWGSLVPGAAFAAIGWTALKALGAWYATNTVERSETVYGPFAATVGVLLVLYLAARVFVYGAELNAVLIEERGGASMEEPDEGAGRGSSVSTMRLVGQVAGDVGALVKKEVELARQEITESVMARVKAVAAFVVIGVIGLFIVGFLGAALAAGLAEFLPAWVALLIVAGLFILLAVVAFLFAKRRLKSPPLAPEKTKETIKEDVEWAKAQLRR